MYSTSQQICSSDRARMRGRRSLKRRQRGGAVVEFAVCLPILMTLVLGSIEASAAIFLKQSVVAAAYEGIREAARSNGSAASADAMTRNVLTSRQVRDFRIVFTPAEPARAAKGERIIIEVSAPISANSPFIGRVIQDRQLVGRAVMLKE